LTVVTSQARPCTVRPVRAESAAAACSQRAADRLASTTADPAAASASAIASPRPAEPPVTSDICPALDCPGVNPVRPLGNRGRIRQPSENHGRAIMGTGTCGAVAKGRNVQMRGIVVGVDGSPNSERALDWAMGQAAAVRAPLTVIAVHEVAKSYWGNIPVIGPGDEPVLEDLRRAAEDMTHRAAERVGNAVLASVTVHAVSGFVVKELVDASQDADLVVVGSRGGSGFARLLMGSVSSEVVQHSACPVVIVPHGR
jgi:nucleotide-binding universal stress UspA family protein